MSFPGHMQLWGVHVQGDNFMIEGQLLKDTVLTDKTMTELNSDNVTGAITAILGNEVLTETDFATHANWDDTGDMLSTGGNATYTHSTGVGTLTHEDGDFNTAVVASTWYKLTYTVSGVTPGAIASLTSAIALTSKILPITAGAKTVYFLSAAVPTDFVISVTSASAGIFTIDDISLKAVSNSNQALTDLSDNTLTPAQVLGGFVQLDPEEDKTLNLPTVALLEKAVKPSKANSSFECIIENSGTGGELLTIAGGTGMTLDPTTVVLGAGARTLLIFRKITSTAWTIYSIALSGEISVSGAPDDVVTVTTLAGLQTAYTAAACRGGIIRHDPDAADAVTLPTAANLELEMPSKIVGATFLTEISNTSADAEDVITLSGNTGVTFGPTTGTVSIRPGETLKLAIVRTNATTYVAQILGIVSTEGIPYRSMELEEAITAHRTLTASEILTTPNIVLTTDAAYNVLVPSGESVADALGASIYEGMAVKFSVRNNNTGTNAFALTLVDSKAGVTLDTKVNAVIYPGQIKHLEAVVTAADTVIVYEVGTSPEVKTGFVHFNNPAAEDTVGCHAQVNLANGDLFATIVAQPDVPRTIAVKITDANDSLTAGTVTVVGLDQNGQAQTAVYSLAGIGGTATLVLDDAGKNIAWSKITDMDVADAATIDVGVDKIEIGYQDIVGLPISPNGQLISVFKAIENDVDATIGAVVEEDGTVAFTAAADGAKDYQFWYLYI